MQKIFFLLFCGPGLIKHLWFLFIEEKSIPKLHLLQQVEALPASHKPIATIVSEDPSFIISHRI